MFEKLKQLKELLTVADKIAIITIILFSSVLIVLTPRLVAQEAKTKDVIITLDNQEIYRYNLEDTAEAKEYEFDFKVEGVKYQGVLRMKDGKVKLDRLNKDISPLPIHAEMGWISKPYQMIVCLPVKLAVTIESNAPQQKEVDLRTF
ncbi:MAG: NusG domain II-containing protein [Bacillota bacterium]